MVHVSSRHLSTLVAVGAAAALVASGVASSAPILRAPVPQRLDANDDAKDVGLVRALLLRAVQDPVARDDINGFLDVLAESDRDRIGKAMPKDVVDRYANVAKEFDDAWKAKFNHSFAPEMSDGLMKDVKVNIEDRGEKTVAVVSMPESGGKTAYILHLEKTHSGSWRLMLPDYVKPGDIGMNLSNLLTTAKSNLAKNETDAAHDTMVQVLRCCAYHTEKPSEAH